jgi:hypothetical protein
LDVLVVYGDREHFANLRYLCGFDPRFEEAALVVGRNRPLSLVVGNEGLEYAAGLAIEVDCLLAQSFSLPGQDRSKAPRLDRVLRAAGVHEGSKVGVAGWKSFRSDEMVDGRPFFAVPHFLIEALAAATGAGGALTDASDILTAPGTGMRTSASPAEVAELEYGAAHASGHVAAAIAALRPGMTELELATHLQLNGYPNSCHPMIISGDHGLLPLRSPSGRRIETGDTLFIAIGLWGGLTARAGLVAASEADLSPTTLNYPTDFAAKYFRLTKRWYESVAVGVRCRDVFDNVARLLREMPFSLSLNPGHYTHADEWVNSAFTDDSRSVLASGSMLQCDMIPTGMPAWAVCNIEDTVCIADEAFRSELYGTYPELAERVRLRRHFLTDIVGIRPSDDVIPLSNLPAWFPPLLLNPSSILCFEA